MKKNYILLTTFMIAFGSYVITMNRQIIPTHQLIPKESVQEMIKRHNQEFLPYKTYLDKFQNLFHKRTILKNQFDFYNEQNDPLNAHKVTIQNNLVLQEIGNIYNTQLDSGKYFHQIYNKHKTDRINKAKSLINTWSSPDLKESALQLIHELEDNGQPYKVYKALSNWEEEQALLKQ